MNFEKIKEAVRAAAEKFGIEEYEIYYMSDSNLSVETLKHEISTFSSGVSGGLCFRCLVDGKMGYASTELILPEEMEMLVESAKENAINTEKTEICGIFSGSEKYDTPKNKPYTPVSAEELKGVALEIQEKNYASSDKICDGTQSCAMTFGFSVCIANSHGLDLENKVGTSIVYAAAVVKDNEESSDAFKMAKYEKESFDSTAIANKATELALEKLGATGVESGKYNIVISGKQMRSLLSAFSPAFSAKNARMGLSLLAGKEGQTVASEIVTLTDDPMREGNDIVTPFDAEGVATYRKNVIENGVLKTLLHNLESATLAGVKSTGNASKAGYSAPVGISPYSFCIEAGNYSFDELLGVCENGIYITELKGLHAGTNAVTGDFSLESAGFMIENGKKTKAVKSFTVAGNFFTLLKDVAALSNKVDTGVPTSFTSYGSPDVLIRNMSVAGK